MSQAAKYLAKHVFNGINEVVVGAKEVMDWLKTIAQIHGKERLGISWVTPIGFPVLQAYAKTKGMRVKTHFGGLRTRLTLKTSDTTKLDTRKQTSGISPNFIHSLDASHMMLTVNSCVNEGITDLAMVHDSYATHACNTGELNYLLRKAFVEQYTPNLLEEFRNQITSKLPENVAKRIPAVPPMGTLDINEVLESDFFFS